MHTLRFCSVLSSIVLLTGVFLGGMPRASSDEPAAGVGSEPGVEEQTRGVVHEAFEKPVVFDPKPGMIVAKQPPQQNIEEVPPDQRPEGDNIAWIAGYWGWDPGRQDFIWVSGFWRAVPVGKAWYAGYWKKVDTGWQWVSGYWGRADSEGVEYLPEPPPTLEAGPSIQAPSDEHIWAPGCWTWYETRYVWRPGYWVLNQPGWILTPAHYVWTPSGCVFVDAYWDFSFRRRGVLFAPVYISPVVYSRPHYCYRPRIVIDVDLITDHYFCYPHYHHCVFGDYYAGEFLSIGISPWFTFHYHRSCYSPTYHYYHCHYRRHNPSWHIHIHDHYHHRCKHVHERPAHTYVAQQNNVTINNVNKTKIVNKGGGSQQVALAKPLSEMAATKKMKLEQVDQTEQKAIQEKVKNTHQFRTQRLQAETQASANSPLNQPKGAAKPMKLNMPKSPVASKPAADLAKTNSAPPELPNAAKADAGRAGRRGGSDLQGGPGNAARTTDNTFDGGKGRNRQLPSATSDLNKGENKSPRLNRGNDSGFERKLTPRNDPQIQPRGFDSGRSTRTQPRLQNPNGGGSRLVPDSRRSESPRRSEGSSRRDGGGKRNKD